MQCPFFSFNMVKTPQTDWSFPIFPAAVLSHSLSTTPKRTMRLWAKMVQWIVPWPAIGQNSTVHPLTASSTNSQMPQCSLPGDSVVPPTFLSPVTSAETLAQTAATESPAMSPTSSHLDSQQATASRRRSQAGRRRPWVPSTRAKASGATQRPPVTSLWMATQLELCIPSWSLEVPPPTRRREATPSPTAAPCLSRGGAATSRTAWSSRTPSTPSPCHTTITCTPSCCGGRPAVPRALWKCWW